MAITNDHKNLLVWQRSITLAGKVYAATRLLPSEEHSGLNQQLRRSAASVATSIAEGSARGNRTEFIQFLRIAQGSLSEIETQVLIAADQDLIGHHEQLLTDIVEIGSLLNGLIRNIRSAARTAHSKACSPGVPSANN